MDVCVAEKPQTMKKSRKGTFQSRDDLEKTVFGMDSNNMMIFLTQVFMIVLHECFVAHISN